MTLAPWIGLAVRSVISRRATAILTVLSVAVAVMLFVGVETVRQSARAAFERTLSGPILVAGPRTGEANLLLYAVFNIGRPTNNITWASVEDITARPDVAWTVPMSLGDSHRGYRVVGTTPAFFERYQFGRRQSIAFAEGAVFDDVFHAVVGASVAQRLGYSVGDAIILSHGLGEVDFAGSHDATPFRISGVLAPTGTPVDQAVYVSLAGIEAIHVGWRSGAPTPVARVMTPERLRAMAAQGALRPREVTALLVGLDNPRAMFTVQRAINTHAEEPLTAVIPSITLQQLWRAFGAVERVMAVISAFVVVSGLAGVLIAILTSLNERRREMAVLRAVGARPSDIFALLVAEAGVLAFAGAVLGVAVLQGVLAVAAPLASERFGVALTLSAPGLFELAVIGVVTGAAMALGAFPAWRAFRTALSDGLAMRV